MEECWKCRERAWRALCPGEGGAGGVEPPPPRLGGGSAGVAGRREKGVLSLG